MTDKATLSTTEEGITISGGAFAGDGKKDWELTPLYNNRWLLTPKKAQLPLGTFEGSAASCDIEIFAATLFGLLDQRFSGTITIDTGRGVKKLFFNNGEVIFASSNLIDDRLGEVIYRAGIISLEQVTNFAVQVNRATKFGKVLLNNRIFNSVDLWNALKLQVSEIVRSVFLVEKVYFQVQRQSPAPFTSVVFDDGSRDLIAESVGFGAMFRHFVRRIRPESKVSINDQVAGWAEPQSGTFEADLLEMVRNHQTIGEMLKHSKLADINTFAALFQLVNRGICEVQSFGESEVLLNEQEGLKRKLALYGHLQRMCKDAFKADNLSFPVRELHDFLKDLNGGGTATIFLTNEGEISSECATNLHRKAREGEIHKRKALFQLESLVQFLMQVASDHLSPEKSKHIRQNILNLHQA